MRPYRHGYRPALAGLLLAVVLSVVPLTAAPPVPPGVLDGAIEKYRSADYDGAITLLETIAADPSAALETRVDALRYLTRCHVAKRQSDAAHSALEQLMGLDPSAMFDPDVESPPLMRLYYEVRRDHRGGATGQDRPDPGIQTLAVLDFHNSSIFDKATYDPLEMGFAQLLIEQLSGATHLKVVERERIQWVLDEIAVQDRHSTESAVRAGKILGAHVAVMGSFILQNGGDLWMGARLVKVESSEILVTESVKGSIDDFFSLTEALSAKIARSIDSHRSFEPTGLRRDSDRLEAMMAYSEGLALLERGRYDDAYRKFQDALDHDPEYERARLKAESIRTLLAFSE